ncbi:hypothetical protein [Marinimicrobium alkaliphilum]|uniref:hypothetical protein n=1 Tax=Marinimicrobium alkaliphilum TaxID=2202654 RepID=UPI0018E0915B|nr:hypothetical protein [Marinimicrobium alkaliphilum]
MQDTNTVPDPVRPYDGSAHIDSIPDRGSAVSWSAILAGAAGAAALSLILLLLGTGLGFSVVSPWAMEGAGATAVGFGMILWLTCTQLAASGLGGYLAGRLRTKWPAVQTDEVFFRDTAHGFLSWAVASLVTAAVLGSAVGAIVGGTDSTVALTADEAREASAYTALWLFITLLIGAFSASVMAVFGGRQRDAQ